MQTITRFIISFAVAFTFSSGHCAEFKVGETDTQVLILSSTLEAAVTKRGYVTA